jgi:dTMP kinase
MFACRSQHLATLIVPALQAGKWVVSDRFIDASYAYQGGGRALDLAQIETLDEWVVGSLRPDVTILLDAPAKLGLARAKNRGPHDRIEEEKVDFFERVRAGYLARAAADPQRFRIIDATQVLAAVHGDIQAILDELLNNKNNNI